MEQVKVSILCLVFNQEKFIRKTLDSLLEQKTDFEYEIIVNDDASTDSSAKIIQEYENKYPGKVIGIYHEKNQYSQGVFPLNVALPYARGEYIAICEGDDYWLSNLKLQMQYDYMISNSQCSMCISSAELVDIDGNHVGEMKPFEKSGDYGFEDYLEKKANIPTASIMSTKTHLSTMLDEKYRKEADVGDIPLSLYMFTNGTVHYNEELLSAYRVANPNSWVGTHTSSAYGNHLKKVLHVYNIFNEETSNQYNELLKKKIKKLKFRIALYENDLPTMRKNEYKSMFKRLSTKKKVTLYIKYCYNAVKRLFR